MSEYIGAIIKVKVPKWQIGQEAQVFFPDTMCTKGVCEEVRDNYDIGYAQGYKDGMTGAEGKWLIEGGTTLHFCCSECGCAGDNWDKFCKHCGAKMEAMKE